MGMLRLKAATGRQTVRVMVKTMDIIMFKNMAKTMARITFKISGKIKLRIMNKSTGIITAKTTVKLSHQPEVTFKDIDMLLVTVTTAKGVTTAPAKSME